MPIVAGAIAVVAGLTISQAVTTSAQADEQLKQIDEFIQRNDVKKDGSTDYTIAFCDSDIADNAVRTVESETLTELDNSNYTVEDFIYNGIIEMNGWRFTWYSEQVLPGEGLQIPGRWSDGQFVRDENGFLCVACNDLEHGTHVSTPFGDAIVYDSVGYDFDGNYVTGVVDIYVSW